MLGINRRKSQPHTEENQTTVDEQTDTHAGVLYLQSSVEGERWERDVIVITTTTTTTTTRKKGQSICREPRKT